MTAYDPERYDIDAFLKDRTEGKAWTPHWTYDVKSYYTENEIRSMIGLPDPQDPRLAIPKPRVMEPDPMLCPNCDMTGRFVKDDYMCVRCRDELEEEKHAA